jgi:hypothetical protein
MLAQPQCGRRRQRAGELRAAPEVQQSYPVRSAWRGIGDGQQLDIGKAGQLADQLAVLTQPARKNSSRLTSSRRASRTQ